MPTEKPNRRAATINNLFHEEVCLPIAAANAAAEPIRAAIAANELTNQFDSQDLIDMQTACTDLGKLASQAILAKVSAKYVPSHESTDPVIPEVND